LRLYTAARTVGRELLIEIIAGKHGELKDDTVSSVVERLYSLGIKPDWWKLEPLKTATAWRAVANVIEKNDPLCRGIVLLGLEAPEEDLEAAFAIAAKEPMVKGFAVGRTIFNEPARAWLRGTLGDEEAVEAMASKFARLVSAWEQAADAQ
jgi:5-dehydro-2-deoxygluconokinase